MAFCHVPRPLVDVAHYSKDAVRVASRYQCRRRNKLPSTPPPLGGGAMITLCFPYPVAYLVQKSKHLAEIWLIMAVFCHFLYIKR